MKKITNIKISICLLGILLSSVIVFAANPKFFANQSVQEMQPGAFALQPEAAEFVQNIELETLDLRDSLVSAIEADPILNEAIEDWSKLTIEQQIPHLRAIFLLEVEQMEIEAPELVIDASEISGPAFFDFDLKDPNPGRVILNPEVLDEMDKYSSLALLIHETRHSAQFQLAFLTEDLSAEQEIFAAGYRAAFQAQKELPIESFCDFLTLLNEYEAFQFGNYVLGKLTKWQEGQPDMGTFASQYNEFGQLKLNLADVLSEVGPQKLLQTFNELEQEQCELIGSCKL